MKATLQTRVPGKILLVSMGGQAEALACADPGARTPIGASGIFDMVIPHIMTPIYEDPEKHRSAEGDFLDWHGYTFVQPKPPYSEKGGRINKFIKFLPNIFTNQTRQKLAYHWLKKQVWFGDVPGRHLINCPLSRI